MWERSRSISASTAFRSSPPDMISMISSRLISDLRKVPWRPPAVEQREGVADRVGVVDVVADEDHGEAAQPRLDDEFQHHRRLVHAERRGRLVEDQHLGAEMDGPGDRDRLALAARQRADRLARVAHVDADVGHAPRGRWRRHCALSRREKGTRLLDRLAAEEEVPRDAHQRDHAEVLEDRRDPAAPARSRGLRKLTGLPSIRISPSVGR